MNDDRIEKLRAKIEKKKKESEASIMATESRGRAASPVIVGQYRAYTEVLNMIDQIVAE